MQNLLDELKEEIFKRRPVLKDIYEKNKDLTLAQFTKLQFEVNDNENLDPQRKEQAISAIEEHIQKLLGPEAAKNAADQLKKQYNVVTADHHGPITHPDFTSSNLLSSFYLINKGTGDPSSIIVLSCANVSFDNATFPRGHLFHSFFDIERPMLKLPFFPYKVHSYSVFGHPGYARENLDFTNLRLDEWVSEGLVREEDKEKIKEIVKNVYSKDEVMDQKYYSDQVALTNYDLWKFLFAGENNPPDLIYIELESLVNNIILEHHLNQETLINKLIFNQDYNSSLMKHFNGVDAAFNLQEKSGTFLFWGLPKDQKYRVQLWKEGSRLVSPDGSFSLELTPESIRLAMEAKELIPSTMLSFIILGFYYGLTLIGGGGQTTYLTQMKEAFIKMNHELGDLEAAALCKNVPTDKLSFLYPGTAFIKSNNSFIAASFLDLVLYGRSDRMSILATMQEKVTFNQAFLRALPYLYRVIIPKESQKDELANLTPEAIDKQTGFDGLVLPVGTV